MIRERLRFRLRYYAKRVFKFIGYCYNCRNRLNYTRYGVGICPNCGLRH
jgi:rRNA maturation endonuclease Nob1